MREGDTGTVTVTVTGVGSTVTDAGQIVTGEGIGGRTVSVSSGRDVAFAQIGHVSLEGSKEHN